MSSIYPLFIKCTKVQDSNLFLDGFIAPNIALKKNSNIFNSNNNFQLKSNTNLPLKIFKLNKYNFLFLAYSAKKILILIEFFHKYC